MIRDLNSAAFWAGITVFLWYAFALSFGSATVLTQVAWAPPVLLVPEMAFGLAAFAAITLPMVVLSMGLGNVQGLGFLQAQGYQVPVNPVSVLVGVDVFWSARNLSGNGERSIATDEENLQG